VLVDPEGRRFGYDTAPYGIMDSLARQHGDRAFAIFDDAILTSATAAGVARYKQTIPGSTKRQSPHWNADVVAQMVREGRMCAAGTLAELAGQLGLPAGHLEATVERYNRGVELGEDLEFAKDPKFLEPIATPPFYGAELRPATVCFTAYGLRIDHTAQVLDDDGRPIPGLFAAGECTGGVVGAQYVGSGNSYANCTVFGRLAGSSAAKVALA
jgi:fumarate reductase flavoprotein subunit